MHKIHIIVPRDGFEVEVKKNLAKNALVSVSSVKNDDEAIEKGIEELRKIADALDAKLNVDLVDAYSITNVTGVQIVGWEIEGYAVEQSDFEPFPERFNEMD